MSSNTISAVLEKLIRHLCLENFPCGNGSWRSAGIKGAETEETDTLLDLLSCPRSPWWDDTLWSPQAAALRQLAVLRPERLNADFVYRFFTTLRIVDKDVSFVDDGLLQFSKLEELVLSANKIHDIPGGNLPSTLKVLELCANQVSSLTGLVSRPPPHLQYLGLGSNRLDSCEDISHLTGRHWPRLVCLDLSYSEFEDQRALLNALCTLPCLKTLVLEGNPLTLASCYPGFTVDSLPQLSCLDGSWISPEERYGFKGLTEMRDLIVEWASASVSVGRIRGIPDPVMSVDENAPEFPLVTYSYYISYEFLRHQTANLKLDRECECDSAPAAERMESDSELPSVQNCEKSNTRDLMVHTQETCCDVSHVSQHSTPKLAWSESMDFSDTQTYAVRDLRGFKRFLSQGLQLRIEEEKVLSWPAPSEDSIATKPNQTAKEKKSGKGKETLKSGFTKDKPKDKKKKPAQELVQDAPITRVLASVHVPLQNLLRGSHRIDAVCDFGVLCTEPVVGATPVCEKDQGKTMKEKGSKQRGGSGTRWKNSAASKGKGKEKTENEVDVHKDSKDSVEPDPLTVELRVELEKWQSVSEAQRVLVSDVNS